MAIHHQLYLKALALKIVCLMCLVFKQFQTGQGMENIPTVPLKGHSLDCLPKFMGLWTPR